MKPINVWPMLIDADRRSCSLIALAVGGVICMNDMTPMTTVTTAKDWASDQEVRWCPGCGDYAVLKAVQRTMPDLGVAREKTVFVSRHRLLEPLSLLHGDLRLPHHPRPRAGVRDRDQARQSRARRVDHHRRRRRAVDRRQPHDARAAPQPRLPDPAVQQRDLRPDQGPIFADQPRRHAHALDPVRLGRPAGRARARSRLGSGARFVARGIDVHKSLPDVLKAAHAHQGASFVEIFQNCIVYNDDVFALLHRARRRGRQAVVAPGGREDAVRRRHQGHRARPRAAGAEGRRGATIPRCSSTTRRTARSRTC